MAFKTGGCASFVVLMYLGELVSSQAAEGEEEEEPCCLGHAAFEGQEEGEFCR